MKCKILIFALIFGLFTLSSCSHQPVSRLSSTDLPCADEDNSHHGGSINLPLDDMATLKNIERLGGKLLDDKKTTPMADLIKQLTDNEPCTVKLPRPNRSTLTPARIYQQQKSGVLVVAGLYKCGKCSRWHSAPASGFVIHRDGIIVTNHHVVASKKKSTLVATTVTGEVYPVKKVLASSKDDDIAICQLDLPKGVKLHALPLNADAPPGTPVTVISHPSRNFYTLTQGHVSRYFRRANRPGGKPVPHLAITADYAKGSSGAPLFDDRGNVIGLVKSTQSIYYSVKDGVKDNLQMVLKTCVPAQSILDLIKAE